MVGLNTENTIVTVRFATYWAGIVLWGHRNLRLDALASPAQFLYFLDGEIEFKELMLLKLIKLSAWDLCISLCVIMPQFRKTDAQGAWHASTHGVAELDTTEQLNWTELIIIQFPHAILLPSNYTGFFKRCWWTMLHCNNCLLYCNYLQFYEIFINMMSSNNKVMKHFLKSELSVEGMRERTYSNFTWT